MSTLQLTSDPLYSLVAVAEAIFTDPNDFNKRLQLLPHQVEVFNLAEFGYDISRFDTPPVYPDGKIYRTRFNCLPWPRKTGKSMTCSLLPASMMFAMPPPIWVGMYGPNDEAAMRITRLARTYIERSKANLLRHVNKRTISDHRVETKHGNIIESFNSSEKAIRGPDIDFAFIDEMDQFEDPEVIVGAIVPATRNKFRPDVGHGIIFGLSTPNKKNKNSTFRKWINRAVDEMALYCTNCKSSFYVDEFVTDNLPRRAFNPLNQVLQVPKPAIPTETAVCPNCET